ncbi:MAG: alpha-glucan family phosphorylase, partial [Chloroflexota bacterium]
AFLARYDATTSEFDSYMSAQDTWFANNHANMLEEPIAYFSMEFAIHNSIPIYAGGLGILAGDICKESSDLGIPLVAVGFMYPHGYFSQHVSADGWQEETYRRLDFGETPITPVTLPDNSRIAARVELNGRTISIAVWQVRVGHVNIYLLDTDVDENTADDRKLSARLYAGEPQLRMQQEIVLGVGGARVLQALGIQPALWHANEGHAAFMMLERVMDEVRKGTAFSEAMRRVRSTTVFTTHTPVPAGHDIFASSLVETHFRPYCDSLGVNCATLLELGRQDSNSDQTFNMTALGLNMADRRLAVSRLHERVTRQMWHSLWPDISEDEVPISHVTNGIHVPTWVAREMDQLFRKHLGQDWVKRHDDTQLWRPVLDIPDEELWAVRQILKRKLIHIVLERAQELWTEGEATAQQVLALGALLDYHALTIGFCRRFAEYKRPGLLFQDVERLKRIVKDPWRPIQIIFAGKSHPANFAGKHLIREVYTLATDRAFQGRIAFVEDYDMHLAHYLVQGVDVWLNNPRRLQEACGTSGMKTSLNGALHLSIRDGWWHEGYNGANGWAIGDGASANDNDPEDSDKSDAEALYELLEKQVVPLYYDQDRSGVPHLWVKMMKEAIHSVVPQFCARRMMKEHTERIYVPAIRLGSDESPT